MSNPYNRILYATVDLAGGTYDDLRLETINVWGRSNLSHVLRQSSKFLDDMTNSLMKGSKMSAFTGETKVNKNLLSDSMLLGFVYTRYNYNTM